MPFNGENDQCRSKLLTASGAAAAENAARTSLVLFSLMTKAVGIYRQEPVPPLFCFRRFYLCQFRFYVGKVSFVRTARKLGLRRGPFSTSEHTVCGSG